MKSQGEMKPTKEGRKGNKEERRGGRGYETRKANEERSMEKNEIDKQRKERRLGNPPASNSPSAATSQSFSVTTAALLLCDITHSQREKTKGNTFFKFGHQSR